MIVVDDGTYREKVYGIWQRNFHDPVPYADFYFHEVYGKNEVLLNVLHRKKEKEESEEKIRGMLHLNPYVLQVDSHPVPLHYIVGVATDEAYRRQGVMRELLEETFVRLRKRGEGFTYLMPADENYYLPFDFRFGMAQWEQEVECISQDAKKRMEEELSPEYTFRSVSQVDLESVALVENQKKKLDFKTCTQITPEYLRRLSREVESEFGKLFFLYKEGTYQGRVLVSAENDYLFFSQIFCAKKENREEFLEQVFAYCERAYHYGKFQLILDESWKDILKAPGGRDGIRYLPAKKVNKIMFRILRVEELGPWMKADKEQSCFFYIEDPHLQEQTGLYEWTAGENGSQIRKVRADRDEKEDLVQSSKNVLRKAKASGGSISIGDLASLVFGGSALSILEANHTLTGEGKTFFSSLTLLHPSCIMEIV